MRHFSPPTFILSACLLLSVNSTLFATDKEPADAFSSVEERRIANSLVEERTSLRKEREELDLRKKELKTLEEGVDKKLVDMDRKLEELVNLQKKIDDLLAAKNAVEQKRIKDLAAIYDKMTPAKAAQAITGLEQRLAADLLGAMKTKAAAKVLDQIAKQKATDLSTAFSTIQLE
jgi:flagellar motility protein MotE (MotC chaperone)